MTKSELLDIAKRHSGTHTYARIKAVLAHFKTPEEFLNASHGCLMQKYNEAHPNSHYGLGDLFKKTMETVRREAELLLAQEESIKREQELVALKKDEDATLPSAPQSEGAKESQAEAKQQRKFFSLKELKAVTAFMELSGIQALDLEGMMKFFDCVQFNLDCLTTPEKAE